MTVDHAQAAGFPQTEPDDIPVFGDTTLPDRVPFNLTVLRGGRTAQAGPFYAIPLDDSSLLRWAGYAGASAGREVAAGISAFFTRVLVDDDGVPLAAVPQELPEHPEREPGQIWTIEGAPSGFPTAEAAAAWADEHGSSLRRWQLLMGDPFVSTRLRTLLDVGMYLVSKAAGRPQQPSGLSVASSPARAGSAAT
jgi:hypothetical protein